MTEDPEFKEDKVSIKSPMKQLTNPSDFTKGKYVLGMHFGSMKSMDEVFEKDVTIIYDEEERKVKVVDSETGDRVHPKKVKPYLRAEKAMKGTIIKS